MCMIEHADCGPTVFRESQRRARKAHKCGECRRVIEPGEIYRYDTGIWDGEWGQHVACRHCAVAMDWLSRECDGYLYGEVLADIEEHYREGYGITLGRMAVNMRRKWVRRGVLLPTPVMPKLSAP